MVSVYIIESIFDNTWYTGMALNAEKRLMEHNGGKNRFTKGHRPWKIIYKEDHAGWAKVEIHDKYSKMFSRE